MPPSGPATLSSPPPSNLLNSGRHDSSLDASNEKEIGSDKRVARPRSIPGSTNWDNVYPTSDARSRFIFGKASGTSPVDHPMNTVIHNRQEAGNSLYSDYKRRPAKFFKTGRIFSTLWSEPASGASSISDPSSGARRSGVVLNQFGEKVFSKVRKFVVIREGEGYCSCLPITTYGGRGTAKPGVNKSEHAIIYTGRMPPTTARWESSKLNEVGKQLTPIRVDPDNISERLDSMSLVHFGGATTVHHNLKVKPFGVVNAASVNDLLTQFQKVWLMPIRLPSRPASVDPTSKGAEKSKSNNKRIDTQTAHGVNLNKEQSTEKAKKEREGKDDSVHVEEIDDDGGDLENDDEEEEGDDDDDEDDDDDDDDDDEMNTDDDDY